MTATVCTVMSAPHHSWAGLGAEQHHSWAGLGAEQRYWESEEGCASELSELALWQAEQAAEVADQQEGGAHGGLVCGAGAGGTVPILSATRLSALLGGAGAGSS